MSTTTNIYDSKARLTTILFAKGSRLRMRALPTSLIFHIIPYQRVREVVSSFE